MNGFDPAGVEADRVCVIPKSVEERYLAELGDGRRCPWYVYGRSFFEGIGAEFREIDSTLQMLLDEVVYEIDDFVPCEMRRLHFVGSRAIERFDRVAEFAGVDGLENDSAYLGPIAAHVHEIVGRCLLRCQEIENNIAHSFVFIAPQENKPEGKTLGDLKNEWRRLTFGQLLNTVKKHWDMAPELEAAFAMFKDSRNLFVQRLSTDPRYDISTRWGVLELLPFLQFFELQTKIILHASEVSVAASMSLAKTVFGLRELIEDAEHDEKVATFFAMFSLKDVS